jgi:hypothetical protein
MKSIGGIMFFFGVGSAVLYFLNMELILLAWIDMWGPTVGWIIRGALAVVGGALWLVGNKAEASVE